MAVPDFIKVPTWICSQPGKGLELAEKISQITWICEHEFQKAQKASEDHTFKLDNSRKPEIMENPIGSYPYFIVYSPVPQVLSWNRSNSINDQYDITPNFTFLAN